MPEQSSSQAAVADHKVTAVSKKEVVIDGKKFYFNMGSTGMSDLMRRLYIIRSQCGFIEDPELAKKQQDAERSAMKKLDRFELTKVDIVNLIDEVKNLIREREENPTEIGIKQQIRKKIPQIDKLFTTLKDLQDDARGGKGLWGQKKIPEDIKKQREDDIILIEQHIQQLKSKNRKLDTAGKNQAEGIKTRKANIDTVDSMKDESIEDELPTIDISDGLKQIEENKKIIDGHLDVISGQLDKMQGLAQDFADELDMQKKLLEKIDTDVQKYTKQIGTMNKRLDWAIKKVGGTTKLIIIAILIIIVVVLIGAIYVIIVSFVDVSGLVKNR